MPVDLLRAIEHANKILDWHENLMEDDIPPEWKWPFDEELKEWFEEIKAARRAGQEVETRDEVPMMGNELATERGR